MMLRTYVSLAAALLVIAASSAAAGPASTSSRQLTTSEQPQVSGDPRWASWLGCWTPAAGSGVNSDTQLCIVPAEDGTGVRMITFAADQELLNESVVADGAPQSMSDKDCWGARTSGWSRSGIRLFFKSSLRCTDQPEVKMSGMSSLITADQWIDVQVANVRGREQVRVRRFWRSSAAPPAPVSATVSQLPLAHPAISAISTDDVIEASAVVEPTGVEAWLAESGARVLVDRQALVRLSDASVPEAVIDLMVALAYPRKFEVRRARASSGSGLWGGVMLQPFDHTDDLAGLYGVGFGIGMPYFYDPYWYFDSGGFYDTAGSGGSGDSGGSVEAQPHGQVINGLGYTQVQPREPSRAAGARQGGSAQGAESSGSGGSGSSPSSGDSGSSGASPSGYSGGGGTSTGLTAVPR